MYIVLNNTINALETTVLFIQLFCLDLLILMTIENLILMATKNALKPMPSFTEILII